LSFHQKILRPLFRLLPPNDRKKGTGIIVLMVINAFLDFFSLASFLPLIFLLINANFISSNKYVGRLYSYFNFTSASSFIVVFTGFVLAFTIFKNVAALWITRAKASFCFTLGSELSSRMLAQYAELSYLRFTQADFSKEINRVANVPIAFANNIILPLANLLSEGLVFLILLLCIALYDIKMFALLVVALTPIIFMYVINRKNLSETSINLKFKYPRTLKHAIQVVEGLVDIRAFRKVSFFKNKFDLASSDLAKALSRDHIYQTSASRLTEIIAALIICSLIVYSIISNQNTQHTFLLLGIYAGAGFRMIPSLNRILNALAQIKSYEYLFSELDGLTNLPKKEEHPASLLPFTKTIEMKDISFQYPDREKILHSVSVVIHKGEKIALVGKSGEGKTTILMLLLQFLHGSGGKLLLDGVEINRNNVSEWRKIFAYVPQSPYILDGTIAENVAFGFSAEGINWERIQELIRDLELEDMIGQFPEGLSTQVGEKGIKLSGGQRQRVAIARALYAEAEVLLLDEVTNQLDAESEQEIIKTLERIALQKKTILMITHHAHLFNRFDRVLTLENGTILEGPKVKKYLG
jgi:ABC-type multidrug transport system fused ATPase/permease subunit